MISDQSIRKKQFYSYPKPPKFYQQASAGRMQSPSKTIGSQEYNKIWWLAGILDLKSKASNLNLISPFNRKPMHTTKNMKKNTSKTDNSRKSLNLMQFLR